MSLFAVALLAQLAATSSTTRAVLEFPVSGLDDSASYLGYHTRFFRDAARNTVQIYLDGREGRVVNLLVDAENESIGFTARDAKGQPALLTWGRGPTTISRAGAQRSFQYALVSDAADLKIGWFLLGSMRVERDFQAALAQRAPFDAPPFALPEMGRLTSTLERLNASERQRHLALLRASDVAELRQRFQPTVSLARQGGRWVTRVRQSALDGLDTLSLELAVDARTVDAAWNGTVLALRARSGGKVAFTVRLITNGKSLTPLAREEIFTPKFLAFAEDVRRASKVERGATLAQGQEVGRQTNAAATRARWLERQMQGVELLASHEKLMAGLPTYATYFGRDMMMTALMMRPIWREEMSEFVIGSVLRKLSPSGQVSHEEALGGQAVREAVTEYALLISQRDSAAQRGEPTAADSLLLRAEQVLRDLRKVRENYHMIDDEFQLPVLVARWIRSAGVSPAHKRAFLLDSSDGTGTRLSRLLRELALVAHLTRGYVEQPSSANLISFAPRDGGQWASTSWRDSNAGYAGGRFAMDINTIWAPLALESIGQILESLRQLGLSAPVIARALSELPGDAPLGRYARDTTALRHASATWKGAGRHFLVQLSGADVRRQVALRLAAMPEVERAHWTTVLAATRADQDSLVFMALALDADGRPIGVANTDPATRLFLDGESTTSERLNEADRASILRDVRLFTRAYPVGVFIPGVGPVVANDSYAPASVWQSFLRDPYHGPRVVWGREVNLFLLGVASHLRPSSVSLGNREADRAYLTELRTAAQLVKSAVEASGFRSELWSYDFVGGRPVPVRYGSGSDIQLWSTTDLVVQFALSQVGR